MGKLKEKVKAELINTKLPQQSDMNMPKTNILSRNLIDPQKNDNASTGKTGS